jgi:membrane fusion protein, multidrug efflux system
LKTSSLQTMKENPTASLNGRSHHGNQSTLTKPIAIADLESENDVAERRAKVDATTELQLISSETATPETDEHSPSSEVAPRKRPVKLMLAAVGVGAIASGAFGYNWWQYAATHVETDNATVAGHLHPIAARIPGTVQQVLVDDNQWVSKGQLLVKLDPSDYQIKLRQAMADLNAAQQKANTAQVNIALSSKNAQASTTQAQGDIGGAVATIDRAQAQVAEAQAGVPKAQAELAQAEANLTKAQTDYDRYTTLFQQGAISRRDLDTAKQTYDVAVAQRNSAQEGVRQAQAKVAQAQQGVATAQAGLTASQGSLEQAEAKGIQTEVSRSDLGTAKAAIVQAQVALKNATQQLSYTNIVAPADGRIGKKTVEVGQQVQATTPLMSLVSNQYWITANFKETQLEKMHPGQRVEIELDAFPHHKFYGQVDSLSPASGAEFALLPPDNATGNFVKVVQRIPVKVVFDAQSLQGYENAIAPGMSAKVTVEVE